MALDVDAGVFVLALAPVVLLAGTALLPLRYGSGFTGLLFSRTSKWRCGPVQLPVQPTLPITSPTWT